MGKQHHGTAAKRAAIQSGKPAAIDGAEVRKTADLLTPQAEAAALPEIEPRHNTETGEQSKTWTAPAAEPGGDPAAKPLCESLPVGKLLVSMTAVDVQVLEPWLWIPVSLGGGGDVAMLCRFTESQIQLLRVKAEEQNISEGEILSEALARMFEHAWL